MKSAEIIIKLRQSIEYFEDLIAEGKDDILRPKWLQNTRAYTGEIRGLTTAIKLLQEEKR